jgi:hypothetical protein
MFAEARMEALQDTVNEAVHERKGEIISEAEDEELITELESRDYVIRKQHAACDCNNSTTNIDRVCDVCRAKLDKTFKGYVLLKEHFRVIQEKDDKISGLNHALSLKESECMKQEEEIATLRACKEISGEPECIKIKAKIKERILFYEGCLSEKEAYCVTSEVKRRYQKIKQELEDLIK